MRISSDNAFQVLNGVIKFRFKIVQFNGEWTTWKLNRCYTNHTIRNLYSIWYPLPYCGRAHSDLTVTGKFNYDFVLPRGSFKTNRHLRTPSASRNQNQLSNTWDVFARSSLLLILIFMSIIIMSKSLWDSAISIPIILKEIYPQIETKQRIRVGKEWLLFS